MAKLWEKPPHTEMKHRLVRRYLQAWLPILSKWHGRIAIIDGFAGPGEYLSKQSSQREPGSPLIILETILNHKLRDRFPEVLLLFIEKDIKQADHLERTLLEKYPSGNIPKIRYRVVRGEFAETLQSILDGLRQKGKQMAPCFAFIDPFGPTGVPMSLVKQFMEHEHSEVLINFAFDAINRGLNNPKFEGASFFDELYGTPEWRKAREFGLEETERRHRLLHELYIRQLKEVASATYVRSFLMRDQNNRKLYYLVFGTKSETGLDEMKKAMWTIDESGQFQFSDYAYDPRQLRLFPPSPNFGELAELIWEHFAGRTADVEAITRWVVTGTERYASNHVKRALKILEERGLISAKLDRNGHPYGKKGLYPDRILVQFKQRDG